MYSKNNIYKYIEHIKPKYCSNDIITIQKNDNCFKYMKFEKYEKCLIQDGYKINKNFNNIKILNTKDIEKINDFIDKNVDNIKIFILNVNSTTLENIINHQNNKLKYKNCKFICTASTSNKLRKLNLKNYFFCLTQNDIFFENAFTFSGANFFGTLEKFLIYEGQDRNPIYYNELLNESTNYNFNNINLLQYDIFINLNEEKLDNINKSRIIYISSDSENIKFNIISKINFDVFKGFIVFLEYPVLEENTLKLMNNNTRVYCYSPLSCFLNPNENKNIFNYVDDNFKYYQYIIYNLQTTYYFCITSNDIILKYINNNLIMNGNTDYGTYPIKINLE